jgi:hypothetical protein
MRRFPFALALALVFDPAASAAVVVIGNFTSEPITFTVSESEKKPATITLGTAQVLPVAVSGPCNVAFPAKPAPLTLRLDVYHAYVFIPDKNAERRLEGIAMPGSPPERDQRPELNPPPRQPVTVPVTLLVDDADPRSDESRQQALRKRFDEAAAVIEAHANIKLEFAGYGAWKSDPDGKSVGDLFADFTAKVKVKPGALAIGSTSRVTGDSKAPPYAIPFGAAKPFPADHVLLRESSPRANSEKVETMIHYLGLALGAISIDPDIDGGTVMRTKIANGLALHADYRFRFDPLNVLAMTIWAEERRRGPLEKASDASAAGKIRLKRVYQALLKLHPGDSHALAYLNELDRDIADVQPKNNGREALPPVDPSTVLARTQMVRRVIRSVVDRAKNNVGPGALMGDALTGEYVRTAANAAWSEEAIGGTPEARVSGFLIGLGIVLDDTDSLLLDSSTAEFVKTVETESERLERLNVLGNPTLRGRRDLCRRFAIGCGAGDLLRTLSQADETALDHSFSKEALARPAGISFSAFAAEIAGIEFARRAREDGTRFKEFADAATRAGFLPTFNGLRDGLSPERFRDDFGDTFDPRFQKVLREIRERSRKSGGK